MKTVFSKQTIEESLDVVAGAIDQAYQNLTIDTPLCCVPILHGGMFLAVDLTRKLKTPLTIGTITTNLYGEAEKEYDQIKFLGQTVNVKNKNVLLFDEICYTGKTLEFVKNLFLAEGAKTVKSVVLIDHVRDNRVHTPDWSVVTYTGTAWLYGQGMDKDGLYRNLEDIVE